VLFRNGVALLGTAIATAMAVLFAVLLLLDAAGYLSNPYLGLALFVAVPAAFVVGLLLIPLGAWVERRRRRRQPSVAHPDWPVIDLGVPKQRITILVVLILTVVNLVIVSVAAYGGVHYLESAEFCGNVCHTTMEPQFAAYQVTAHSRVACVECHVGPGAGALVESKLAGTRQLWQVVTGNVPTPMPSPVHSMRPARDTCEQCHWPEKQHGDKTRLIEEFADDEQNTGTVTKLLVHVGGGSAALGIGTGIHWHMNVDNEIEYVAADETRATIPYVRLKDRSGKVREFVAEGATPDQIASGQRRRMDCMDCHNRPAHTFTATPQRAIDTAIALGQIPRELPFVRREAVAAVSAEYSSRDAALEAIAARLNAFYREQPVDGRLLARAVAATRDVWTRNVFPAMKVTWGTYPNHLGHVEAPGCFRCHDDSHRARDGSVIRQDCELCHAMPAE